MRAYFILEEAIQALRSNMLRSLLTIIGIVVGIFSVTAMLALGAGLSGNILDRFKSFSSGDITITGDLTQADFDWIKEQSYTSGVLASQSIANTDVIANGEDFAPRISVYVGDYTKVRTLTLTDGTSFDFTDATYAMPEVLVDEGFVSAVQSATKQQIGVGSGITLNGQKFTIRGVIEGGTGNFGRRGDGSMIVPYGAAIGVITNTSNYASIGVSLVDNTYYEVIGKHILEALNTSRGAKKDSEDLFSVSSAQDMIENAQETTSMISLFLGIVGGIALFVGGIGTMNMMLTTVTERTKEIGLRKAIGARDRDILLQILVESVLLTSIGGAIGIALTYLASMAANYFLTSESVIQVVMSGRVVAYATIVAVVVGIVFGLYPARNASRLQPVDALRAD